MRSCMCYEDEAVPVTMTAGVGVGYGQDHQEYQ